MVSRALYQSEAGYDARAKPRLARTALEREVHGSQWGRRYSCILRIGAGKERSYFDETYPASGISEQDGNGNGDVMVGWAGLAPTKAASGVTLT